MIGGAGAPAAKLTAPVSSLLGGPAAGRRLGPVSCAPDTAPSQEAPAPAKEAPPSPPPPPLRASSQLSRWSGARTLRSGRRLGSSALMAKPPPSPPPPTTTTPLPSAEEVQGSAAAREDVDDDDDVCVADAAAGKPIYIVSDGTGWTAEHSVNAALGQFEHCLVDRECAVSTHLFSGVDGIDGLLEIIKQAAKEGALVLYTLADPSMAEAIKKACDLWGVPSTDVLGPTIEAIASHIGVAPSGIPRSSPSRQAHLTEDYFRRIEAVDFTIKQDDGALPENLHKADIVLVGVSRTGKTPLSIYLAQKGYKVANVPIVMVVDLPKALFEINQDKIFALTINPVVLQAIRNSRAKTLGFSGHKSNYAEMEHVRQELSHAKKIFAQNPMWPVIEVTGRAVEETAAVILRIYHDRKQKCSMPRISKLY